MRKCYLCKRPENFPAKNRADQVELRPYGPKGEDICFRCMKASPEREETARKQFLGQLDACGEMPAIGLNVGPIPLAATGLFERRGEQ